MNIPKDLSNVFIHISHRCTDRTLELSKYDDIAALKCQIYNEFGIEPDKQVIESWTKEPENDDDLIGLCCPYPENYLCLQDYVKTQANYQIQSMKNEDDDSEFRKKEEHASFSFLQTFSNNYDSSQLLFHVCRLEDAIQMSCFTPNRARKVIVLYFHNSNDKFSKIFGENLQITEVQDVLAESFFLLGWDVTDSENHDALKSALNNFCELETITNFIDKKTCAALLIVPVKDSITMFSCLRGNISNKNFLESLKKAQAFLSAENRTEEQLAVTGNSQVDMGSTKFQQVMLDMLGDRDYDNFDHFEHDKLKEKIAFALYGPPQSKIGDKKEENNETNTISVLVQNESKFALYDDPQFEYGYKEHENKEINKIFEIILKENNLFAMHKDRVIISFIYNCTEPLPAEKARRLKEKEKGNKEYNDYNPNTDLTPLPIFILQKCIESSTPCRTIIDHTGRVYQTWRGYLTKNKLLKCEMVLPLNGCYAADDNGCVLLERHLSPACGLDTKILQGTDVAGTVLGLASGGVMLAAAIPAVAVAPLLLAGAGAAGIGVGIYSIGRSAYSLFDRGSHKETLHFGNSEARGAYLNIVAGAFGFVGAGANMAVSQLAARGVNIGQSATAVVNVINVANLTASGVTVGNSGYDMYDQWRNNNQKPTFLSILQLGSSVLFFGHAVYSFRGAATIIDESHQSTLQNYQDSLRSNRHRKIFNKMMKETVRQSNDDVRTANAKVIKTIRNLNKDDAFAALTRSNKLFNEENVRFHADNGGISLNGVKIDMGQFSRMDRSEVVTFIREIPNTSITANSPSVISLNVKLTNMFSNWNFDNAEIAKFSLSALKILTGSETVQEKIINTVSEVISTIIATNPGIIKEMSRIFPNNRFTNIMAMVLQFFQSKINVIEDTYQEWLKTRSPELEEPYFTRLVLDWGKRAIQLFNILSMIYFVGVNPTPATVKELIQYFYSWFTKKCVDHQNSIERENERLKHNSSNRSKITCKVCQGVCYIYTK